MIICGIEEPLNSHSELYTLDASSSKIVLGGISAPQANRYIFVWKGSSHQGRQALALLARTIIQELAVKANWVSAWAEPDGDSSRDKILSTRLARMQHDRTIEDWGIFTRGKLSVALKQVSVHSDLSEKTGFSPATFNGVGWKRIAIILGKTPDVEELFSEPSRSIVFYFARFGTLAPNKEFVSWLIERNLSLLYSPSELTDCTGIACIGPHIIPVERMAQQLDMEVRTKDDVMSVWQTRC